jgi:putative membrane protein
MKSIRHSLLLNAAVAVLALGANACGGGDDKKVNAPANNPEVQQPTEGMPESQSPANTPTPQQPATNPTPQESMNTPEPQQPAIPTGTGSSNDTVSDDAQIAAVTNAVSTGEVQQAQLAQSKATRTDVKQFAQMMVNDHRMEMQKQTQLLQRLQIAPQSNPVAMQVSTESQDNLDALRDAKGKEFDKQYMQDQVKAHQKALDLLDNQLIPNAKNPDLKANLQQMRPKIAEHLRKAQSIQEKIEQGTSGSSMPKDSGHKH